MPNTLAHIAVQGLANRATSRRIEAEWILLGCVVPDVPWIAQRFANFAIPCLDPFSVRLYSIVQASLFSCVLLCMALSLLASHSVRVFAILAIGSTLHLLLDASEIKWANGVHLLAPYDWRLLSFDLYWPESWVVLAESFVGCVLGFVWLVAGRSTSKQLDLSSGRRIGASVLLLALYFGLPVLLLDGPRLEDNHFVRTLQEISDRSGRLIELDRVDAMPFGDELRVWTFTGEALSVVGDLPAVTGTISLRGRFESRSVIRAAEVHVHHPWFRDVASYVGLTIVLLVWLRVLASTWRHRRDR